MGVAPHRPPSGMPLTKPGDISGWIEAAIYVFIIALLSLSYALAAKYGAHPTAFILYAMAISAIGMLAVTGFGADWWQVMTAPQSWLVGSAIILIEIFYYVVLTHVPLAHGNLLMRLVIPIAMMAGWAYAGRRPRPRAMIGAAIIAAAVAGTIAGLNASIRTTVLFAALAAAAMFAMRSLASEFHPWNRAAQTISEKIRVTGLVVFVTSITGIGALLMGAVLTRMGVLPPTRMLPAAADFLHGPTLILSLVVGLTILTTMAYLNFSSVVKITSENFACMSAFTPVATLVVERTAAAAGIIPRTELPWTIAFAMVATIGGVFVIFSANRRG